MSTYKIAEAHVRRYGRAPRVGMDGVCEACEEMPDGSDGRANFCTWHREHPATPTQSRDVMASVVIGGEVHERFCRTTPATTKPPAVLAAERAETDAITRALRLREAANALCNAGFVTFGDDLAYAARFERTGIAGLMTRVRGDVQTLRLSLLDGSNEPRFAACDVALEALGRLWCRS